MGFLMVEIIFLTTYEKTDIFLTEYVAEQIVENYYQFILSGRRFHHIFHPDN